MGNVYAYMRISTAEERGKQGYSRQEKALEAYAKRGWKKLHNQVIQSYSKIYVGLRGKLKMDMISIWS